MSGLVDALGWPQAMVSKFQSVADRDGTVQAGMETGVVEGHERLDEILQALPGR